MPIGKGSDTFLKLSEIFVASRLDPKSRNSRIAERVIPSATYPRESVLPIRLRPDFLVVLEGYARGAEHWPVREEARKRSLRADILRTC